MPLPRHMVDFYFLNFGLFIMLLCAKFSKHLVVYHIFFRVQRQILFGSEFLPNLPFEGLN
jgi:hypothetical protein